MRTCPNCGATLKESDSVCPYCGSNVGSRKVFTCVNCNHPVSSSSPICPYCGKNPHMKETIENTKSPSRKDNFYVSNQNRFINGIGAGIILVVVLNLVGLVICLILGDRACKKGALITFAVEVLFFFIIYLIISLTTISAI